MLMEHLVGPAGRRRPVLLTNVCSWSAFIEAMCSLLGFGWLRGMVAVRRARAGRPSIGAGARLPLPFALAVAPCSTWHVRNRTDCTGIWRVTQLRPQPVSPSGETGGGGGLSRMSRRGQAGRLTPSAPRLGASCEWRVADCSDFAMDRPSWRAQRDERVAQCSARFAADSVLVPRSGPVEEGAAGAHH